MVQFDWQINKKINENYITKIITIKSYKLKIVISTIMK